MKKDKNGTVIKIGDTMVGLYSIGDDEGVVVAGDGDELLVKDSDGDLLMIEEVIYNGCTVKLATPR